MTAPTLTEFLLARYAELEAESRSKPLDWLYTAPENGLAVEMIDIGPAYMLATHPDHVLADLTAKRRVVEQVSKVDWAGYAFRDFVLCNLAAVYADHPDYREEWKP